VYPPIEPYDHGMLDVGDGHRVYWEVCGNPRGRLAVFLHGGPGGGCGPGHRRLFDPRRYRAVLVDQRGCGRSRPLASEPDADLTTNTTRHLIADLEAVRRHLDIDRWTVVGVSWGTTLGLAYAQAHRDRVTGLVLGLVTTTTRREVTWMKYHMGRLYPRAWERFVAAVPASLRHLPLVDAYATFSPIPIPPSINAPPTSGPPGTTPRVGSQGRRRSTPTRPCGCGSPGWSRTTGGTPRSSTTASSCAMPSCSTESREPSSSVPTT
jgi:proline iminopeptidase